ncbi:hypothetical protein OROGR_016295 [Orobanche gracilis]
MSLETVTFATNFSFYKNIETITNHDSDSTAQARQKLHLNPLYLYLYMTARSRLLSGVNSPPSPPHQPTPPKNSSTTIEPLDADFVVIIAALLCALICVLGLAVVARCDWIRRCTGRNSVGQPSAAAPTPAVANKGLKKKVLKSLPKSRYGENNEQAAKLSDCAICLAEFGIGQEIRVLPQCGHGFHVLCIDKWLLCNSSCPSCRQILQVARCHRCGGLPATTCSADGPQPEPRDNHVNSFLP